MDGHGKGDRGTDLDVRGRRNVMGGRGEREDGGWAGCGLWGLSRAVSCTYEGGAVGGGIKGVVMCTCDVRDGGIGGVSG